jgi:hypothetical protein
VTAVHHPVTWAAPRPLWSAGGGDRGLRPTILRFASDEFMDQLLGMLESDPHAISSHVAKYESWRSPQNELVSTDHVARTPLPAPVRKASLLTRLKPKAPAPANAPVAPAQIPQLKLFQPAHQRHYVVTATLACALPGMPDRKPAGPNEQLGFVVRRLMDGVEHAYVKATDGWKWQRLAGDDPRQLAPAEERIGVFPLSHRDGRGIRRSLWGGVVPVGKREEYLAAALSAQAPSLIAGQIAQLKPQPAAPVANSKQARLAEYKMDVAEPWKALVQSAYKSAIEIASDGEASALQKQTQLREKNWQYQTQSWLLLLDLMAFLERHIEPVFKRINGTTAALNSGEQALFNWFNTPLGSTKTGLMQNGFAGAGQSLPVKASMAAAMKDAFTDENRARLEAMRLAYRANAAEAALWPAFRFLLGGISSIDGNGGNVACLVPFDDGMTPDASSAELAEFAPILNPLPEPSGGALPPPANLIKIIDDLTVMVARAMDNFGDDKARLAPFAMRLSQTIQQTQGKGELFVIRFVHLNEDCGPTHPPTLSEPTEAFEMASFFDSDAPARPIRITLPMDTSPAGLRKHAKGTAFVLSDMLCGQVQRAKGLGFVDLVRQVLPWPLHKDIDIGDGGGCKSGGIDIGMICSISIPIITLCALILLMIIISLLDFIFRWIPWFIMCFPVPGLKGKKSLGATP